PSRSQLSSEAPVHTSTFSLPGSCSGSLRSSEFRVRIRSMTDPSAQWETARLVARRAARDAAPQLFEAYAQDPDVARYMIWRPHRGIDETIAFLDRCESAWQTGTAFPWTLWMKDDGRLAGMIEARLAGRAADMGSGVGKSLGRR